MSAFPSSTIGLPSSVNYSLPPSLSENAKSYFVSVSPDNLQEVVGSTGTGPLFVANATIAQTPFNMTNLYFSIPGAGSSSSLFIDPAETTLSFQLQITVGGVANTPAANAVAKVQMIGSAASWFDSLAVISNNLPIEQLNNYSVLHHILMNNTVNSAERQGACAIQMGVEDSQISQTTAGAFTVYPPGLNGCELPDGTVLGTFTYNFCIPLISILGIEGAKTGKLFPIGMLANLQLMLTTAQWCPFTSWFSAIPNPVAATYTNIRLTNFRLGLKYIDIGDIAASMLMSSFPDGKLYLKTATYQNANCTIPAGSIGQQILYSQLRASSVKSLFFHYANQGASSSCPNFMFDSVNPNIVNFNASINGIMFPQYNILPVQWPAMAFSHVSAAFGSAGNLKSTGGSYSRSAYGICAVAATANGTAPNLPSPDAMIVGARQDALRQVVGTGTTFLSTIPIALQPNSFLLALDLEKSASTLFQGVNSRASGVNQNITIFSPPQLSTANAAVANVTFTAYSYAYVDCVLVIDLASKSIMAFV